MTRQGVDQRERDFAMMRSRMQGNRAAQQAIETAYQNGADAGATALQLLTAGPEAEAGWRAEWQGSEALQAEFLSEKHYLAFKRREATDKANGRRG